MLTEGSRAERHSDPVISTSPQVPIGRLGNPDTSNGSPAEGNPPEQAPVNSGLTEAVEGTSDGLQIRDGIEKLNGDGDSAYLRVTPEAKVQGNLRGVMVGGKGQLGADMRITQNGEGDEASYTLRYDKHGLGALTAELGTDTLGRGKGSGAGSGNGRIKLEPGAQSFDAVEMRFDTREDAIRAAEAVQRLHVADMMNDGANLATSAMGPAGLPVRVADLAGGSNPLGNPLNEDGAPGYLSQQAAGVEQADIDFLRDHVTAYETTVGTRGRLAAEIKGDMRYFNIAAEGRLDGTQRFTRRVELPTEDAAGSLTYTVEGGLRLSAKEKAQTGFNANGLPVQPKLENRLELASGTADISLHYTIPKGTDVATSMGGRPTPEADAVSGEGNGMVLDRISLNQQIEYRTQGLQDPSRGDTQRLNASLTINEPARLTEAAAQFFGGNFDEAARTGGAELALEGTTIERSGTNTQNGVKLGIPGLGEIEGTVILESGLDDVTGTRRVTVGPSEAASPAETETRFPPAPVDDGRTLVVVPHDGATLRGAAAGEGTATAQNGTFLRDEGGRARDADGHDWIEVSGTDTGDQQVRGWVRADLVEGHSSATGAMDQTGRINPRLEHDRYDTLPVTRDDNLWDLAVAHDLDPQELIALNRDHLRNPSLIFAGDTVYIPGTDRGPKPEIVEVAPPVPAEPSVTSEATGESASAPDPSAPNETAPQEAEPPAEADPDQDRTDRILAEYQVIDDEMTDYAPNFGPIPIEVPFAGSTRMTQTEADLMDQLGSNRGVLGLMEFKDISSNDTEEPGLAYRVANRVFPQVDDDGQFIKGGEDGHNDAFRHAYWSALMVDRFGEDFAAAMGTAHEGVPGNPADKEAMDLYNNEVGRTIARENPGASDDELADLVFEAVENGEMIVIDGAGRLAYSNQVEVGRTGDGADAPADGTLTPPEYGSN